MHGHTELSDMLQAYLLFLGQCGPHEIIGIVNIVVVDITVIINIIDIITIIRIRRTKPFQSDPW